MWYITTFFIFLSLSDILMFCDYLFGHCQVYEKKERVYTSWWRRMGFGSIPGDDQNQNPDTRTKVDAALLHDIVPQPGGDYEPLLEENSSR